MRLTIDLSPDEEARLTTAAKRAGLEPAALARKLLAERLPVPTNGPFAPFSFAQERVRALLAEWQDQDNFPVIAGPEPLPGETPTGALFRKWAEENATMTDAEREAEDRLWEEIERGLTQNNGLRLRRAGV